MYTITWADRPDTVIHTSFEDAIAEVLSRYPNAVDLSGTPIAVGARTMGPTTIWASTGDLVTVDAKPVGVLDVA